MGSKNSVFIDLFLPNIDDFVSPSILENTSISAENLRRQYAKKVSDFAWKIMQNVILMYWIKGGELTKFVYSRRILKILF